MLATLLPPNRTPLEDALERTSEARFPLPVDLVSSVWSPDRCPAHLLGYLAWQLSLDLWDETWPETKKREVCRDALRLHRLKTTPAGIKAHVALVGGEVRRIIRPPASGFRKAALTEEARLAWLDSLPQIRIYPFANIEPAPSRSFYSGLAGARFYGPGYRLTSRGPVVLGRRATFYDRGVEVPVSLTALEGDLIERVFLKSSFPRRSWYASGHYGRGHWTAVEAQPHVVTVRTDGAVHTFDVGAGVTPVNVLPQRIAQHETAAVGRSFWRRKRHGEFRQRSRGPLMLYDRIALNDPSRTAQFRRVQS